MSSIPPSAQAKLGFVGLGSIGARMARRLIDAGRDVTLYDLNVAAVEALLPDGGHKAESLAALAARSEIVFLSLPSPAIVLDTTRRLADAGGALRVVVDLSTTGRHVALKVSAHLKSRGIGYVEAPVSGGLAGARAGTLSLMVAGDERAVDAAADHLSVLGRQFRVGAEPGTGQLMKLINNLLNACAITVTAEGMALGIKGGLDPAQMIAVLNASTGRNSATQDKWPRAVLPRTFDFGFSTGLCLKDVVLCEAEAAELGVRLPLGAVVRSLLEKTASAYGAGSDFTSVAKLAETEARITAGES